MLALSGVLIAVSSRLEPLDLHKGIILGAAAGGLFGTPPTSRSSTSLTPPQIAARMAAFCLIILGVALLPGRVRAGTPTPADPRAAVRTSTSQLADLVRDRGV